MSRGAKGQVERMLALVPYLRERGGVRVERVARDFGVTPKQIQDDLAKYIKLAKDIGLGK